jgi:hypothetical protein
MGEEKCRNTIAALFVIMAYVLKLALKEVI